MAMEDPSSHIVASIHSFVGIAQIEEKLLRIFMRNPTEEKCGGEGLLSRKRGMESVEGKPRFKGFILKEALHNQPFSCFFSLSLLLLVLRSLLLQFFAFSSLSLSTIHVGFSLLLARRER